MADYKVDTKMLAKDVFLVGFVGGLIVQLILCFILGLSISWGVNHYLASIIAGVIIFGFHLNNIHDVFVIHGNSFISIVFKLCSVLIILVFVLAYNNYLFGLRVVDFSLFNFIKSLSR